MPKPCIFLHFWLKLVYEFVPKLCVFMWFWLKLVLLSVIQYVKYRFCRQTIVCGMFSLMLLCLHKACISENMYSGTGLGKSSTSLPLSYSGEWACQIDKTKWRRMAKAKSTKRSGGELLRKPRRSPNMSNNVLPYGFVLSTDSTDVTDYFFVN